MKLIAATLAALLVSGSAYAHPGLHHLTVSGALSHPLFGGIDPLFLAFGIAGLGLALSTLRK